jgi:hypothetical protein
MGFIRGVLLVIASVLLFLSFLVGNVFLTLSLSLDYDNVHPELVSVVRDMAEDKLNLEQEIEEKFESMELYCENDSEFVFSYEPGQVFVIPCDIVSQGSDAVIEYGINSFVEEIYYKDYDCDFWDCLGETEIPFFLVSEKARDYWNNKFCFLLIVSVILIALMFFLVEQKSHLFFVVGSLLAISALPFMKINWALSFLDAPFLQFFTIFFVKAYIVFLISFSLGILLLVIGLVLKLFEVGFKISGFFERFKKRTSEKKSSEKAK